MIWRRELSDTTYGVDITLLIGPGDETRAWLRKTFPDCDFDQMVWTEPSNGKTIQHDAPEFTQWFLWLPDFDGSDREVGTVIHECAHLTFQIMRDVGVILCRESEEAYTYYLCSLFKIITKNLEVYKRHRRKPRKKKRRHARR